MIDWKHIGKKLLFPPVWVVVLLAVISTATLIAVFVCRLETHPLAYAVYVIAFYTVCVIGTYGGVILPKQYQKIKKKLHDNKLGNRYLTDAAFRTHVSLYTSLTVNLLYIGVNVVCGFWYGSAWFGLLAGYYTILAVMRFLLLRYVNAHPLGTNLLGEWKRARVCASILTLINLVLSGAILMMMYRGRGFAYYGILIYVMAMYTFYITTLAIVNMVKYRKLTSPVMTTAKIVTLAAALVSMLSLETAMLEAFGADTSLQTRQILIAATGAGISVIVIGLSSYMIVRSTKEINKLKQ